MTPYFVLFGFFAFLAVADPSTYRRITPPVFMILWAVLTVFIGLRHEVGADWLGYNNIYFNIAGRDPLDAILQTEAGYGFLNWVSYNLNLSIYGVNLFCGGVIAYALLKFCNRQSNFFVAFTVATPILLILIGMSLTRQATALGFLLLGFMAFEDKRFAIATLLCILAVSFHTSAMIAIAVFFAGNSKNRIALGLFGAGLLFIGYILVGEARLETYQDRYLDTARASEGALIRILLGCVAAGLYL